MKLLKPVLTAMFVLSASLLFSQTESETLEWLNIKKTQFSGYEVPTYIYLRKDWNSIVIDSYGISYLGTKESSGLKMPFTEIKEVIKSPFKELGPNSYFDVTVKGSKADAFFSFWTKDYQLIEKYTKALKHIATLKGAKLINDDLF